MNFDAFRSSENYLDLVGLRELDGWLFLLLGRGRLGCSGLHLGDGLTALYGSVELIQLDTVGLAILENSVTANAYCLGYRVCIHRHAVFGEALDGPVDGFLLLRWFGVG